MCLVTWTVQRHQLQRWLMQSMRPWLTWGTSSHNRRTCGSYSGGWSHGDLYMADCCTMDFVVLFYLWKWFSLCLHGEVLTIDSLIFFLHCLPQYRYVVLSLTVIMSQCQTVDTLLIKFWPFQKIYLFLDTKFDTLLTLNRFSWYWFCNKFCIMVNHVKAGNISFKCQHFFVIFCLSRSLPAIINNYLKKLFSKTNWLTFDIHKEFTLFCICTCISRHFVLW